MTWYAAHIVIGLMPIQVTGGPVLIHENVVLVKALSEVDALEKAKKIGQTESALQDDLTLNGVPAKRVFAGIRKLITISNAVSDDLDQDRPSQGTEITYSVYEVSNEKELQRFASGSEVSVKYVE